jgi:predicted amidohydrolase
MRVAVCQLNSRADRARNLATAVDLLERAAAGGADLAMLPEYVDYLGPAAGQPTAEDVDGEFAATFSDAARRLEMWVVAGSFHEVGPDRHRTYNTSLVFDRSGARAAVYRKIHLYDVDMPGRVSHRESAHVAPGEQPVVVDVEGVRVGLSICYDLRFPELYRHLAAVLGAQILVVPAAFMLHTGRDHWEVLLRARAIENQCFVAAAGQIGDHDPGRTCYGRSMIIDPWGTILAQAPDVVGTVVGDLDLDRLTAIRRELPSLANRRMLPSLANRRMLPSLANRRMFGSAALQQQAKYGETNDSAPGDYQRGGHPGGSAHRKAAQRDHEHGQQAEPDRHLPDREQHAE